MTKPGEVINEYRIPKGYSGVAVRAACEFIIKNPGASQSAVLKTALLKSRLNPSTANWITSPGNPWNGKSPATKLWDRLKVKNYSCYPNEFTGMVTGSDQALTDAVLRDLKSLTEIIPTALKSGDLIKLKGWETHPNSEFQSTAMFIGIELKSREGRHIISATSVSDLMEQTQVTKVEPCPYLVLKTSSDRGLSTFHTKAISLLELI